MLEVPLEAEEKSIVQNTVENNISVQEKSYDNSENILKNSQACEEINEEPLSSRESNLFDEVKDESLYETQPTFNTRESVNSPIANDQSLSSAGGILSNLAQKSATPKNEGNIKISLIGRIQVHGGFNQTPMLISFDAIPDRSSVSTESSTIKAIETTAINLPLNDSSMESTFDLVSTGERANDEASDSLNTISGSSREAEKTNADKVRRIKSREKFFGLTRRGGEERKVKKNPSRIEKRLNKYNTNSRSAKQVFLTDYSVEPNGKVNRADVGRMISERTDETVGKLNSRSTPNPVYFPDTLGSVLVNNDTLKDQNVIKEPRCRIDVPTVETNRSDSIEVDPSNTTTLHIVPLVRVSIEKPTVDRANDGRTRTTCCPREDPRNATFGGCYRMPATVRKFEITETTSRELQTSGNYRNGDPTETFPPGFHETSVNDRNAATATECTTNGTRATATPSGRCNNDSPSDAIRARNMMAIVRFMMKLLRIIAEDEEPACPRAGETVIHVKNVVINASSHVERQKGTTDRAIIKSGGTRQDFVTTERRSTVTERIREESSPFESFTEAPSHPAAPTLPTSSDEVSKGEGLSTVFETATEREVYASALSNTTSFATPKSFLFYEPARKSLRKDASRKDIRVELTGVKQNSNVSFKGSKDKSGGEKSRLDGGQTNRSSSRDQDRSSVDRLHFGKQGTTSTTNPGDKVGPYPEKYLARGKNVGFRRSESTGAANDTVGPIFPRDNDVSRNALLEGIGAARENRPECPKKARQAGVSDRRAETRTKLLNRSARGGPPGDWIGEHRAATRRLLIDKKLRESRKVPGGTATPGKVVFRRGEINRPPDPNLVSGRSDSFKIEGNVAGNGSLAKLSVNDALSTVGGALSSLEREDTSRNAIRYSTSSLMDVNAGAPGIGREIVDDIRSVQEVMRLIFKRFYVKYLT